MVLEILQVAYLMLPAYIANMMPVFADRWIKGLRYPLDFHRKFRSKRIFGANKTIKGVFSGALAAIITVYIQHVFSAGTTNLNLVDYENWLLIGFLLGFGVLSGDAVKSFFKRQFNILPGERWIPFDQIDFTIGALLFISPFYIPSIETIAGLLLVTIAGHVLINKLGYVLRLKKVPW